MTDTTPLTFTASAGQIRATWDTVIRAAAPLSSGRPELAAVAADFHAEGVRLTATDAYLFLTGTVGKPLGIDFPGDEQVLIGSPQLVQAMLKALDPAEPVRISYDEDTVVFTAETARLRVPRVKGAYVNWRGLIAKMEDTHPTPKVTIGLGRLVAGRLLELANDYDLTLTFTPNAAGPVRIHLGDNGTIIGLVMPLRDPFPWPGQ